MIFPGIFRRNSIAGPEKSERGGICALAGDSERCSKAFSGRLSEGRAACDSLIIAPKKRVEGPEKGRLGVRSCCAIYFGWFRLGRSRLPF